MWDEYFKVFVVCVDLGYVDLVFVKFMCVLCFECICIDIGFIGCKDIWVIWIFLYNF